MNSWCITPSRMDWFFKPNTPLVCSLCIAICLTSFKRLIRQLYILLFFWSNETLLSCRPVAATSFSHLLFCYWDFTGNVCKISWINLVTFTGMMAEVTSALTACGITICSCVVCESKSLILNSVKCLFFCLVPYFMQWPFSYFLSYLLIFASI